MSSNLNNSLEVLFDKMENFISTKTVVGEPIHIGEVIMLPLVDVSFGVGAGSGERAADKGEEKEKSEKGSGGGGGLGAKITPSAVLVIKGDTVQLVDVKSQNSLNKLIDMAPGVLSKLNLDSLLSKVKGEPKEGITEEDFSESKEETEIKE